MQFRCAEGKLQNQRRLELKVSQTITEEKKYFLFFIKYRIIIVLQVIPSRLPDGQVVFLLPSHYVQVPPEREEREPQDTPIDFSLRKSPLPTTIEEDGQEDVWRPW